MKYQLKKPLLPILPNYTVIDQIFAIRGLNPLDSYHLLHTTDEDIVDPLQLDNMKEGASILIKHIANEDDMMIIVDSDADGMTSAACLINYLYKLFPSYVINHITYKMHEGKQHGINDWLDTILKENKIKILVVPDAGSNDYEAHKKLKENGIDVLIIDHHEADHVSEDACVINNQLCNYPTKSLSGVGVVYKFCCYIDSLLNKDFANDFLDLVAVGLIGDVMSMKDFETRHLVNKGLANIKNPFIAQMVETQNYSITRGGGLNPFTVAFYIVPQINGTIRMGETKDKMLLFESMLDYKGWERIPSTKRGCAGQLEPRAEQACRTCSNIKRAQGNEVDKVCATIDKIIEDKELLNNKIIAVKLDKAHSINRNLIGLVANKAMSKYKHPILILSENDETQTWDGSGRGYETAEFSDLRSFLQDSQLVEYAEGHANACGVSIPFDNFDKLIDYANNELATCNFDPCYKVDFIWHANDFTSNDIIKIAEHNSIWGQGVEEPLIAIEHIHVTKDMVTLMSPDKNPTLKIALPNGTSLIKFKSSQEEADSLCSDSPAGSVEINIVGKCKLNEWNGTISAQIEVQEYEITGLTKYLF